MRNPVSRPLLAVVVLVLLCPSHSQTPTPQPTTAPVCIETEQCCYSDCECNQCWRHDSVCQVSVPAYGDASTLQGGQKLCPFNPSAPMCETTSSCYFWLKESGTKTYMCPSAACDTEIVNYCGGLGYVHPSVQQAVITPPSELDLGCAPLIRLGTAPYSDWAQEYDTDYTPANAPAWPSAWTTRAGIGGTVGGASYYAINFELSASVTLTTFRTDLSSALNVDEFYVSVSSSGTNSVQAKVYTAEASTTAQLIIAGTYTSAASLSSYTFTSTPTYSWTVVSNSCYCESPPGGCGAGYADSTLCPVDNNVTSGYETSAEARSGIDSIEPTDFSNLGAMTGSGIIVGSMLVASVGGIYLILTVTLRTM